MQQIINLSIENHPKEITNGTFVCMLDCFISLYSARRLNLSGAKRRHNEKHD